MVFQCHFQFWQIYIGMLFNFQMSWAANWKYSEIIKLFVYLNIILRNRYVKFDKVTQAIHNNIYIYI